MRILVVDDEKDTRDLLMNLLETEGHSIAKATNAAEALSLVQMEHFNLILLDIMMPGMDGHHFADHLTNYWKTSDIPIVAVSCRGDQESKDLAEKSGCVAYIKKPFVPGEILGAVERFGGKAVQR